MYVVEDYLRVRFDEHGRGAVNEEPGLHDEPVVDNHLLILQLQDIPGSIDALKLPLVVNSTISELKIDFIDAHLQDRLCNTPAKCSSFSKTIIVSFRPCISAVFTTLNASRSSSGSSPPANTLWKK